jgi:hypothetical protein
LPPDSSDVDAALVAQLQADTALKALMPDGVFMDEAGVSMAPAGGTAKRFVIVSLVDAHDTPMFEGRASENAVYLVKAVELKPATGSGNIKAAAARIDALLELGTLTIAGYGFQVMRRVGRIRMTEVDDVDPSIRWQHRGGRYQVVAAPIGT